MKNTGNLYRLLISGLFLALYVFITLPVQYWHHHSLSTYTIEKEDTYSSILSYTNERDPGINCTICSHQYAVYFLDIDPITPSLYGHETLFNVEYLQQLVSHIRDGISNKGPPVIV